MQSRKVSGVNVISIFQRLHPPCTLVYCVDRTRVHCELLHCVQIMHICWQYHPDNILVSPQHVHKLVRLNVVWTSSGVSANFTDQDLFSQVLFSTQFQTTLMVMDTTIRQPSWRRPETQSSTPHFWDHCPVSLSWENKLVGTLLASKDWSYNFKLISFWSSGDWDQKGQVDYKAFKFVISDMWGHQNIGRGFVLNPHWRDSRYALMLKDHSPRSLCGQSHSVW